MTDDNDSLIRGVSVVEEVEVPPYALHVDGENPNEQSDETFGLLVDSIRDGAWLGGPIIVNRGSLPGYDGDGDGLICDGEHRWRAAQEADRDTVPVKFCEFRHDAVRRYYRLHLNKVSGEHDSKRDALEYDHLLKEGHSDAVEALTDAADEDLDDLLAELRVDSGVGPEYEYDPDHNVYFEDCVEGMRERLDDDSVDCVITDPPYGINVDGDHGDDIDNDETIERAKELLSSACSEMKRIMKETAHAYFFWTPKEIRAGLDVVDDYFNDVQILIWKKNRSNVRATLENYRYPYNYEVILYAADDGRPLNGRPTSNKDVLEHSIVQTDSLNHRTEKPVNLISELITNSTDPDDTILDPFMGSGTTAVASVQNDREYVGFEVDGENYRDVIERRIGEAKRQREAGVNSDNE